MKSISEDCGWRSITEEGRAFTRKRPLHAKSAYTHQQSARTAIARQLFGGVASGQGRRLRQTDAVHERTGMAVDQLLAESGIDAILIANAAVIVSFDDDRPG
jgi:hypothetical protein